MKDAVYIHNRTSMKPLGHDPEEAILSRVQFDPETRSDLLREVLVYFRNGNCAWASYDRLATTEEKLLKRCEELGLRCPATALCGG